jgi:hypothetical protein
MSKTTSRGYTPVYDEKGKRIKRVYERNGSIVYRANHPITGKDWWIPFGSRSDWKRDNGFNTRLNAEGIATIVDSPECKELVSYESFEWYQAAYGDDGFHDLGWDEQEAHLREQVEAYIAAAKAVTWEADSDQLTKPEGTAAQATLRELFYRRALIGRTLEGLFDRLDHGVNAWGELGERIETMAFENFLRQNDEKEAKQILSGEYEAIVFGDEPVDEDWMAGMRSWARGILGRDAETA